ncbi:OmpW/AlkL family protein [Benzoatithermus flavus]|uniref:OmpW family outer membrane protein n=1 Tax=Benzoatithermus flavus TaxID=3108223 RepID=A0ABU8XMT8_9PROT
MRWNRLATVASLAVLAVFGLDTSQARAGEPSEKVENGKKAGDFMIRLRGIGIVPTDRAKIDVIGGDTDISNEFVPEADFSYFLTDNLALELIAATARHDVRAKNTAVGDLDLGKVNHLPPTLLLQWHVAPDSIISPYFGAGINYTIFYNADVGKDIDKIEYDNSLGWALQAGTDVHLASNWWLNLDVKYIHIQSDVEVNNAIKADVDVNPWIFGIGLGYKF